MSRFGVPIGRRRRARAGNCNSNRTPDVPLFTAATTSIYTNQSDIRDRWNLRPLEQLHFSKTTVVSRRGDTVLGCQRRA